MHTICLELPVKPFCFKFDPVISMQRSLYGLCNLTYLTCQLHLSGVTW